MQTTVVGEGAEVVKPMQVDLATEPHTAANQVPLLALQLHVHIFNRLFLGFKVGSHAVDQLAPTYLSGLIQKLLIQLVEHLPPCGSSLHGGLFRCFRGLLLGSFGSVIRILRELVPYLLNDFHGIFFQPRTPMSWSGSFGYGNVMTAVVINLGTLICHDNTSILNYADCPLWTLSASLSAFV